MRCTITAVGDALLTQRLCRNDPQCLALKEIFDAVDIRFANFEMTVHDFEVSPSAVSGGTWVADTPRVIDDLQWLGLNLFSGATNHSLDWGTDGLLATMKHLDERDVVYAGIGRNLAEASMPRYIDTAEGRVALISVSATGKDWHMAGEQRPDTLGRPGINMLRFNMVNYLPEEDIAELKRITDKTYVNARRMQLEREGFSKPTKGFAIGTSRFEVGEAGTKTFCNKKDLARILRYTQEARRQADVVIVSLHVHEFQKTDKALPPDFAREFSHAMIDGGADLFLAHGPHILRGIEVYKGKPILHGLGNFFMQSDSVARQPQDFYNIYNLGLESTSSDGFSARTNNWTTGQSSQPKVYESVIARFVFEDGGISAIELIPITLGFEKKISRKGRPELALPETAEKILRDLQKLSDEFGTQIEICNGRGFIHLSKD